jgi:predicted enzyme related to lactoylglutathione lyase
MSEGVKTIIYPVSDPARGKAMFSSLLGIEPYVDQPYYIGYKVGDQDIGLDPNGHRHGATPYFEVEDIDAALKGLVDAGAEVQQEPHDVGGGLLIAVLKDGDGNIIGLRQPA